MSYTLQIPTNTLPSSHTNPQQHVDAIRELTGHAGAIDVGLDLGDDDGLLEGDDGLSDDDGEEEV